LEKEHIYFCASKKNGCKYKLKLTETKRQTVSISESGTHNHEKGIIEVQTYGIPHLIKLQIYESVENGIRPRKIHLKLHELYGTSCPKYDDVRNCVYYYRRAKLGEIMSKGKEMFDRWVEDHSRAIDDNSCYVLDHKIDKDDFALALSSKKLIANAIEQRKYASSLLFIDSTYKLVNSGLLLMVAGTQTIEHQFRPIAFKISLKEDAELQSTIQGS
jgi:hypothetical protein